MSIELYPPASGARPFKRFKLQSGREVSPNFAKGGSVIVLDAAEEAELRIEGWSRAAAKAVSADDLRKIATAAINAEASRTGIKPGLVPMRDADIRRAATVCEARHFWRS